MDKQEARTAIDAVRESIRHHDYRYYGLSQPEISDVEYDQLMKRLEALEKQFPELVAPDSPTQRVSGEVSGAFPPVKHRTPML